MYIKKLFVTNFGGMASFETPLYPGVNIIVGETQLNRGKCGTVRKFGPSVRKAVTHFRVSAVPKWCQGRETRH